VEHLLANGGFDPALGARPMRGAVQRLVEGPIAERVLAGELAVAGLAGGQLPPVRCGALERHVATERDLALVVDEATPAGDVAATLRAAGARNLRSLELFDVYRGAPLAAGEKSLAWRLRLQGEDGPLDEGALDALVGRLVAAVAAAHGGRLRA
jgi:phenylalanyl-tRNA synthetase beta subunit